MENNPLVRATLLRPTVIFCLAGILAILSAGCSQQWTFSHGETLPTTAALNSLPMPNGNGAADVTAGSASAGPRPGVTWTSYQQPMTPPAGAPGQQPTATAATAQDLPSQMPLSSADPGPMPAGSVAIGTLPADPNWPSSSPSDVAVPGGTEPGPLWQPMPGGPLERLPPANELPAGGGIADESLWQRMWDREAPKVCADYRNYYSWSTACGMLVGFGLAAGIANSDLDGEFQTWYQQHVASTESNHIAEFWKPFGQGQYAIPVVAVLALLNDTGWLDDRPVFHEIGEWGDRVARAYLVGAAPMLAMQELTGGSRPTSADSHSAWIPFSASNGVSGDAFMASCLFISAADMSDQLVLKGFFYACSFMTPWERIDLNQHFLSQAALGWWMGYLACRAVNNTELADRHVVFMPMVTPEMTGVGVMFQH